MTLIAYIALIYLDNALQSKVNKENHCHHNIKTVTLGDSKY